MGLLFIASHCGGFSYHGAQALGAGFSNCSSQALEHTSSVVVVHGLSCSSAHGIITDQGSNPSPLHWQVDSYPLPYQGSPQFSSVTQSCPTLVTPWTVAHQAPQFRGFVQERILEWVAISFFRGSSRPRDQILISCISCIGRWEQSLNQTALGGRRVKRLGNVN